MRYVSRLFRGIGLRGFVAVAVMAAFATCAFAQATLPAAGGGGAATAPSSGKKPKITVVEMVKDFGTLYAGPPPLTHAFKVSNTGEADLHITKVVGGCGCTAPGEYPHVLKPGESGEFPFTINTSAFRGPFVKMPTVYSDDPTTPELRLTLKGDAKRHIDVLPSPVIFQALGGKEVQVRTVKITNNTETPLKLTMQSPATSDVFKMELTEKQPGKEFELKVTAAPPWGDTGQKRANVILQTNIEQEKQINVFVSGILPVPPVRIDVRPSVVEVMRPSQTAGVIYPPPLPQASQPASMPVRKIPRIVRFTNNGETPVKILEVSADDPAITTSFQEYQQGKMYLIQLEMPMDYLPPQPGRKLTIKTDDAEKPVILVPIIGKIIPPPMPVATRPAQPPQLAPAETLIGKAIPVFKLTTESGKPISNDDLGAQVAVLDFFAPKCPWCRRQMPIVDQIRKEYEAKGVRFLFVSQKFGTAAPTKQDCTKMMEEIKVTGDLAMDPESKVGGELFKALSFPTMVILDKKGKVAAVNIGGNPDVGDRLKKQLDALLAGKPIPPDVLPPKNAVAPAANQAEAPAPATSLIGKAIPVFKLATESGKPISNDDLGAQVAVLDFFSPRCGFCRRQMPIVDQIRKEYEAKGVRFLFVSQKFGTTAPTKQDCTQMMEQIKVTGDLAMDPESKVGGELFKATGFPTMVILDKSGKVAAVNIGATADLADRTKKQLDALLAGKPIPQDLLPPKGDVAPAAKQAQLPPSATSLVGKPIPAFKLTAESGKPISHDALGAPVAVLDFFSPKCGFCKRQMPIVDQIRKEYEAKGVRFLFVSQKFGTPPTKQDCTQMMEQIKVTGDLAMDPESKVGGDLFNATGYPTMVILDKSGKVAAVNIGATADLADRTKKQLDALLAGKPIPSDLLPPKPEQTAKQ